MQPEVMPTYQDDDGISLRPFFSALWRNRRKILIYWGATTLAAILVAVGWYLTRSSERTARIEFRLVFDGADRGEYPNGTRFSRSDIIASPVLNQVYQQNELERYLSYERFSTGLFVFESSREIDMLNLEYQAKLSDARLAAPQRAVIETEFRQKLESLRTPQFSLQFVVSSRTASPPSHLMEKALNDILAVWAEQTAVQRGALGYQIEILTPNVILKDTLNTQTMLIRYDLLRRHVGRVRQQVDRLAQLPGANTTRVGSERLSLIDLRTNLEDLLEFQLNPLIRRRLIYALPSNEVGLNILYLEDRLIELRRIQATANERKRQLETALNTFTADAAPRGLSAPAGNTGDGAVATQLSDTFLDRLMDLAGRSGAMDYRTGLTDRIIESGEAALEVQRDIGFYEETLRLLRSASSGNRPATLSPEDVVTQFKQIQDRVVQILEFTNEAYATVSAANLNPRSVLYRLTGPYSVQTIRSVSARYLAMVTGLTVFLAGIAIAIGVAALDQFRNSTFAQAA